MKGYQMEMVFFKFDECSVKSVDLGFFEKDKTYLVVLSSKDKNYISQIKEKVKSAEFVIVLDNKKDFFDLQNIATRIYTRPLNCNIFFKDLEILKTILQEKEDLKAILELKEQILTQNAKYVEIGKLLGYFAHQLKQPLNSISIDMIKLDLFESEQLDIKNIVEDVNAQIRYINESIYALLEYLKPQKEMKIFNLKSLFDRCIVLIKDKISRADVEFKFYMKDDIKIKGVENELMNVFLNICNNSLDAFIENRDLQLRVIEIKSLKDDKFLKIRIKDTAGGAKEIEKVAKYFYTTKKEGSGLGLAFVKEIIEKYNGKIKFFNEYNGFVVEIILPSVVD